MKTLVRLSVAAGLLISASAASAATKPVQPSRMTCQEFLSLDQVQQPKIIYWTQGANPKGGSKGVVDIATVDSLIPVVVEQCKSSPRASLWSKIDSSWHKLEADVKRHL
jgi:acid stress chaperone HdeA